MKRTLAPAILITLFGGIGTAAWLLPLWAPPPPNTRIPEPFPTSANDPWSETHVVVERGQNITEVLGTQGIGATQARAVVSAAAPHVNLAKIRAGESLTFRHGREGKTLIRTLDPWGERSLVVELTDPPHSEIVFRPLVVEPVAGGGEVDSTLWDTGISMGLSPENLLDLAKIFAWDIDFNTEIQQGDRFRLVIEEIRDAFTGERVRYGSILAAEFHQTSGEVHTAYRYLRGDGTEGFYDAAGESSVTPFLKSPLEFSFVSSNFGRRYHPVLKRWRAHKGTDYAAATGTPIRSIADGTVSFVGTKGGYGRHVRVEHEGQQASSYSHLSATSMKKGQRVRQGDTVGKVGSTGLATGPHLHFEFYVKNQQVDYGSLNFARTKPLAKADRPGFEAMLADIQPLLEGTPLPRSTCEPIAPAR